MENRDQNTPPTVIVSSSSSPVRNDNNNNNNVTSPIEACTTNNNNNNSNTPLKSPNGSNIQRPKMTTFNTIHTDKYPHSLRDFPLHHFDRNLTVEKATFDPPLQRHITSQQQQQQQQQQTPLTVPSPHHVPLDSTIRHATINSDVPTDESNNASITDSTLGFSNVDGHSTTMTDSDTVTKPQLSTQSSPSASFSNVQQIQDESMPPSFSSSTNIPEKQFTSSTKRQDIIPTIKMESERRPTKKKKRKLPPVNGTATPSEVFHRNLVDAVSNVEDSDEHEQYVYPYSHHDKPGTPLTNNTTSNNNIINNKKQLKKRNQDLPTPYRRSTTPSRSSSTAASTFSLQQATNNTGPPPTSGSRGFLTDLLNYQHRSTSSLLKYTSDNSNHSSNHKRHSQQYHQQQKKQDLKQQQDVHKPYNTYRLIDEENGTWIKRGYRRPKLRSHVMDHPRSSAAFPQPWSHEASSSDDNDDDDDQHDLHHYQDDRYGEHIYLLRHHPGQQRKYRHTRSSCSRIVRNTFLSILLFVLLMLIFTVYKAEPLTDVSASMGHILASDKELIFDLMVKANNWNWWTVRIQQADLSVFAFSELVPFNDTFGVDPAEYLGDCLYFDEPLSFTSSVILGRDERASTSTQIRIKSPGADASGNQRWSRMIRYPYGLVTRGVIKYRPFSLLNLSSSQSIPLCVVTHVDPITSITTVYFDDDHGYCSHYPILTY